MPRTSTLADTNARLRVVGYPSDYDIHHSNSPPSSPSSGNESHNEPPSTSGQPTNVNRESPDWPNHYRRIPPYRPVNRDLNQGERRVYTSGAERAFITIMFLGVGNNARMNKLWRMTGEKINDQVFRYKIGGEW